MSRKKALRRFLIHVLIVSLIFTGFFAIYYAKRMIPEKVRVVRGEESEISFQLPIMATLMAPDQEVTLSDASNIPSDQIHVVLDEGFSLYSEELGQYALQLNLFGLFHFRDIEVQVVDSEMVVPCGCPVGIYLETDGILIVGTGPVTGMDGVTSEPAGGIVRSGDYILAVDGRRIFSKEELVEAVCASGGSDIVLKIRRGGEELEVKTPVVQTAAGEYKAGIWVRDDTQGIGTLSYVDMQGGFGALGHGISDTDTGILIEDEGGILYDATIRSITRGTMGTPGSLAGIINYSENSRLGEIYDNTEQGIYGRLSEQARSRFSDMECLPVGYKQDVSIGPATIRCCVDGTIRDFGIQITRIDLTNRSNKGMVIEVTDPELLALTGGIVQGMSGSPIIQNGKMVGAVTHVFVQDSTKGYGIFLENMLEH